MTVLGHRTLLVVAFEYAGADVPTGIGAPRLTRCEHAFDVRGGMLVAHQRRPLRVAFPDPQRAWPAATPQVTRCAACTLAVTELIRYAVTEALDDVVRQFARRRTVDTTLLWLLASVPPWVPPPTD